MATWIIPADMYVTTRINDEGTLEVVEPITVSPRASDASYFGPDAIMFACEDHEPSPPAPDTPAYVEFVEVNLWEPVRPYLAQLARRRELGVAEGAGDVTWQE